MAKSIDVHEKITNRIIEAIEKGAGEFKLPWHRPAGSITRPTNIQSKKAYRGINVVTLWVEAQLRGYATPVWGTYKQFQEAGCQVRKGEKASLVVFYKEIEFERDAAEMKDGDDPTSSAWLARGYWVFNAEQVDGYELPEQPPVAAIDRNDSVEAFMASTGIETRWGGHSAYYRPSDDAIQMPERGLFTGTDTTSATEALYATWLHEGVHATGHKSRLARTFGGRFGDSAYAREELAAELTSAFLCAALGIVPTVRHADYLGSWLEVLRADNRAIFKAASQASKAADYLLAFSDADHARAAA